MGAPTKADFVSHLLGRPVQEWIFDQRAAGKSWDDITFELNTTTAGKVRVTRQTIRNWSLGDRTSAA